ncbi:MAG: hypothetical protein AVDCRST_MAG14-923 [uncultured Rubrobacteraceae bacterium]|uniref:Uncharacterized protein n=1 Tax=uncultured Rubrobacteraceae bacterium TaxID=349277 RepID=A0A6J4QT87_9ACTN|nr:MAG: hypothetical protein AVDCRST_MAG14-923 [uncultured Rubrobacteraceae bacterium]
MADVVSSFYVPPIEEGRFSLPVIVPTALIVSSGPSQVARLLKGDRGA